jgi:hypothetical protein
MNKAKIVKKKQKQKRMQRFCHVQRWLLKGENKYCKNTPNIDSTFE